MPAVRIARLAVDIRYQGYGVGSSLLAHAVRLAHEVMQRAAVQVLIVDALDDTVADFYSRWGFRRFQDDPRRLFLTSGLIRASAASVWNSPT
jgi:N-acetylglutamate synthase-like GNAT family acetyltransferase